MDGNGAWLLNMSQNRAHLRATAASVVTLSLKCRVPLEGPELEAYHQARSLASPEGAATPSGSQGNEQPMQEVSMEAQSASSPDAS